jgi:hypothetical protein
MAYAGSLEPLVASGHPLHTRTLTVEAFRSEPGRLRVDGVILDLRKCGFVPTGGELQTAGFIHHMQLSLELDAASARIERLVAAQPTVAFEPTPASGGDSCRDPVPRLQALVGERIDAGFVRRLGGVFGGALGCSHLLTLAQWQAASLPRFLAAAAAGGARGVGERVGKRTLFLDGFERPEGGLEVAIQQSEFETTSQRAVAFPLDRLARQHELRVLARLDAGVSRLEWIDAVERERSPADLASAAWRSRSDRVAGLAGGPALRGLAARVLGALGDAPADAPLRDALLNLAPGVIQCLAALSHRLVAHFQGGRAAGASIPRELSVGGYPDSCYMWRSDGPMARARAQAGERGPA